MNAGTETCHNAILSDAWADFIVSYGGDEQIVQKTYGFTCYEIINQEFLVMHQPIQGELDFNTYSYPMIPDLLGLLDTTSMEKSGILPLHLNGMGPYKGEGVLVGVIDTGIDYLHPVFRYSDGHTRIRSLWDQTIQSENMPEHFPYGTLYTQDMIDEALASDEPYRMVPSRDEEGHGTFMAGIMAGGVDWEQDFVGAAPEAGIVVVKLKPAKTYLRDYYKIKEDALAYEETDIFMAVQHVINESVRLRMPVVICLGLGNTLNSREGTSYLSRYLDRLNHTTGICIVVAGGNELGYGHHVSGMISNVDDFQDVELKVADHEKGFQMELWGGLSDVFSIEIESPEGERIPRFQARLGQSQYIQFPLEPTKIFIMDRSAGLDSGAFLVILRMEAPTAGLWRFRIYGERILSGRFDLWLPMEKFIERETYFLSPDPDVTITSQATTISAITTANYDHYGERLDINSSRGYTLSGIIKPDLTAPGVDVFGPLPGKSFGTRTGSSISAAHTAGCAAILFQWGLLQQLILQMDGNDIRRLLIQGARHNRRGVYPDRGWGYGILDLKNTFESLRIVR